MVIDIYFCKLHGTWQITLNAWGASAVGSPENQPELNPLPLKGKWSHEVMCVCVCVCVFCRSFAIELNWIHCCCLLWVLCGLHNLDRHIDGGLLFLLQSVQLAFISRRAVGRGDGFSRLGVLLDVPTLSLYMIYFSWPRALGAWFVPILLAVRSLWRILHLWGLGSFHLELFSSPFVGC
jgi:hypothetical protein